MFVVFFYGKALSNSHSSKLFYFFFFIFLFFFAHIVYGQKGNKGWWLAKDVQGREGLVPSNYFDPPVSAASEDAAFDAKVSWSQTLPQIRKSSGTPGAASSGSNNNNSNNNNNCSSNNNNNNNSNNNKHGAVDSFGLDEWAKEMEQLLLSTPAPLGERRNDVKKTEPQKKVEDKKVEEKKVEEKKVEDKRNEEKKVEDKRNEEKKAEEKKAEEKKAEEKKENDEWIMWMQRAIQAEQDVKDLVNAAEADKRTLELRLEEANAKAMEFQDQVSRMIEEVNREKLETESRHRQELAAARSLASNQANQAASSEVEELRAALEKVRAEKEDLIVNVEADVLQFTQLLDEERRKHVQTVQDATAALEQVAVLEARLQEQQEEHERALSLERLGRQQAEQQLAAKSNTSASSLDELKQKLAIETHLKEALLLENTLLKQQLAKREAPQSAASGAGASAAAPPPVAPRESEVQLRSKAVVASSEKEPSSAAKSTAEVKAELARQRLARHNNASGHHQEDKVAVVVSRMSQDLGKGPALTGGVTPEAGATVSRSRANEILMRAKALAAKTKGEMEGKQQ